MKEVIERYFCFFQVFIVGSHCVIFGSNLIPNQHFKTPDRNGEKDVLFFKNADRDFVETKNGKMEPFLNAKAEVTQLDWTFF